MTTNSEEAEKAPLEDTTVTEEDATMKEAPNQAKGKFSKTAKGHEISSVTIQNPLFSYACLQLLSDPPSSTLLDDLTVRTYLTSAFAQFLGLTGSAISVDILKVEGKQCWIRVPREDLSAVIASISGWIGGSEKNGQVAWRVKASGNWLGSLVRGHDFENLWT